VFSTVWTVGLLRLALEAFLAHSEMVWRHHPCFLTIGLVRVHMNLFWFIAFWKKRAVYDKKYHPVTMFLKILKGEARVLPMPCTPIIFQRTKKYFFVSPRKLTEEQDSRLKRSGLMMLPLLLCTWPLTRQWNNSIQNYQNLQVLV